MGEPGVAARLCEAIRAGTADDVRRLFIAHPDQLNQRELMGGWLGHAAAKGRVDAMAVMVELGAEVNLANDEGSLPNGQVEATAFLIRHGSRLPTHLTVANPLFAAITGRSAACVRMLLDAGIDAGVRYTDGRWKDMDATAFALLMGAANCAGMIADRLADGDEAEAARLLAVADMIADRHVDGKRRGPTLQ